MRSSLVPSVPELTTAGVDCSCILTNRTRECTHDLRPRVSPLPPEIHAVIIDYVASHEDGPDWLPNSRIFKPLIRDTFHALCLVNRLFESLAVRHLYSRVHITTQAQLAAFRKAVAYFGRPTALARYVQTFSISCTTHIASYQVSDDLITVLYALHPNLERLLLDIRTRHHFRPSHSPNTQDTGPVILCGGASKFATPSSIFNLSWPKLTEVSISEGLDQIYHAYREHDTKTKGFAMARGIGAG
ncbi:hypothetical protein OPQ81_008236 [Rhizoctonia solani]|nr:hypothetical protein OPQ81_008236 [Rhizoctonia solani]